MRNRVSSLATSLLLLLGGIAPTARAAACPAIAPENIAPLQKIAPLCIPSGLFGGVFLSPDSGTMMTWNLDGEVLVWKCDTWEKRSFQPVQNTVTMARPEMRTGPVDYGAAAVPPDGQLSVTADGGEAGPLWSGEASRERSLRPSPTVPPCFILRSRPAGAYLPAGRTTRRSRSGAFVSRAALRIGKRNPRHRAPIGLSQRKGLLTQRKE